MDFFLQSLYANTMSKFTLNLLEENDDSFIMGTNQQLDGTGLQHNMDVFFQQSFSCLFQNLQSESSEEEKK